MSHPVDLSKERRDVKGRPVAELHPSFCRQTADYCDSNGSQTHRYIEHKGSVTQYLVQDEAVELSLQLTRHDELLDSRMQHCQAPAISLTLRHLELIVDDFDVHLSIQDAELIEHFLHDHLERLRRSVACPDSARFVGEDDESEVSR